MTALAAAGLRKRYGQVVALDGVDLEVAPGEVLGLVGPNGAGKSTLLAAVAGLTTPDAGSVRVYGADGGSDRARALIGLAPQELAVYPTLTVERNLVFFARLAGMGAAAARRRCAELAEALELTPLGGRQVGTLGGGQQRRVHVAAALAGRPRLLLLDEPSAAADLETRAALVALVRAAAAEGAAVCYATHQLDEVEALGASVAVLHRGQVVARGSLAELVAAHASPVVELGFSGPVPAVPGLPGSATVNGDTLRLVAPDPGQAVAAVLRAAGADGARLRSVQVISPGLAAVFTAVTGEVYPSVVAP